MVGKLGKEGGGTEGGKYRGAEQGEEKMAPVDEARSPVS